jgi:hypothetical protein
MNNPEVQQRYHNKYGTLAEQKIIELAREITKKTTN